MTKPKKTVLQIPMTEAQSDLMDFLLDSIYGGMYSKSSFVLNSIRDEIKGYVGLGDFVGLTDELLLELAIAKNKENIISAIGKEKYNQLLSEKEGDKNE